MNALTRSIYISKCTWPAKVTSENVSLRSYSRSPYNPHPDSITKIQLKVNNSRGNKRKEREEKQNSK